MGSSCVWILFVDHRFQAIGPCFQVDTASVDIVESLKEMARDKRPIAFFRADANPADCIVWRTKGDLIINSSTIDNLEQILRSIDECDEKTIEDLLEDDEVESLQLSDGEVLLLQMPARWWYVASNDESDAAQEIHAFGNCTQPTDTTECTSNDSEGSQSSQSESDHPEGSSDNTEELEASGYKVVPDIFETDGGTWELINKLPPHLHTVYRRKDPNKTEYIAKLIRERSREPDMFNFLRMTGSHSPHVILPIETITSATRNWLILPKMVSIYDQQFIRDAGARARYKLAWGLIDGLAYLHKHNIAHRDIKPANLVCDDRYRLQIIDLDVAIKVQDENTETDQYRGTKGWTAPEMGLEDGPTPMYSPIKADRWSCGRVILQHIMMGRKGVWGLTEFANLLMAEDPQQRPSLLEENTSLNDIRKYINGKSTKASDAKKPYTD